ncbi:uncharacterized protein EDB91DRAFT_1106312 [Suillus paluster]|uniref:uncharacterized protein n=1 Tax=Suillus paluster TaxID=48578 RepID=UPI001B87AC04|nr:uncharacterized protein EDB91DRAFT_1106312 [Suillus paluster]KAG1751607.1 hypothetical protein EDB91DRAFT_1106312 [Suillus paluster]
MAPTTATTFATGTGKRRIHHRIFGHGHRARYEGAINTTHPAEYHPLFTYPTSTLPAQSTSTPHAESTASGTLLPEHLITVDQTPTGILAQQLPLTIPNGKSGGNVIAVVAVAVVVMGSLLGVIVAGEILKRRNRRCRETGEGGSKGGTDLVQDKGKDVFNEKSLDSSASSLRYSPTYMGSPALHLEHATRPVETTMASTWFSRIFWKTHAGLHRKDAESPEASHTSRTPTERSTELPQRTTWSDFSYAPESLSYPRPLLHCILEECEDDCQSQSESEIALTLGLAIQRSLDSVAFASSVHMASRARSFASLRLSKAVEAGSIVEEDCAEARMDAQEIGVPTSVPIGMSVSLSGFGLVSTASLQTLGTGASADRESLREEIFELRRVQTRSMQMDKPILLSLGIKTTGNEDETDEDDEPSDAETEHAASDNTMMTPSIAELLLPPGRETSLRPDLRDLLGSQMTLATLASSYSAVNLDDFPLPPSIVLPRP